MKCIVLTLILSICSGAMGQISAAQKADLLDLVRLGNFRQSQLIRLYEAAQQTQESYERYLKELEQARGSDPAIEDVSRALAEGRELTSDEEAVLQRYRASERPSYTRTQRADIHLCRLRDGFTVNRADGTAWPFR